MVTLESILERDNLNRAYKQVKANKGGPGVDGMTVDKLSDYLRTHAAEIVETVKAGKYIPQPVRRVMIPKEEKGKFRPLGIPTATDRVIQQAIAQKPSEEYEPVFSDHSHGFRPYRSCQTAIDEALAVANEGYVWIVDLDLSKFFDTVNHSKLLQLLSDKLGDARVISLIHKILRAPIQEDDKVTPCQIGTPQGGPVSPVLANIMLNELDHELERRGHRFVRYADDMMIFCRSKRAAERTLECLKPCIEGKLFLKLNEQKTKICRVTDPELKFLGFGFWRSPKGGEVRARPHQKSKAKCRLRLRAITSRIRGQSLEAFRRELKAFVRGWVNYFKSSAMNEFVKETDEWLLRRIRQIYWKRWKKVQTKYAALRKLGVKDEKAWEWANTRKSYWHIANSWILSTTLNNGTLRKLGWTCLGDVYH